MQKVEVGEKGYRYKRTKDSCDDGNVLRLGGIKVSALVVILYCFCNTAQRGNWAEHVWGFSALSYQLRKVRQNLLCIMSFHLYKISFTQEKQNYKEEEEILFITRRKEEKVRWKTLVDIHRLYLHLLLQDFSSLYLPDTSEQEIQLF